VNAKEDLLERGFQLAYFIFPSRPQAVRILRGAINKLKAQRGRESRRAYWRDKYLKRGITRIAREEGDMLQWLIFYESDPYEREQEASRQSLLKDMVLRYIKSLVRITSAMSSFHVNIGLHRLLHNYSTTETQQVYESITDRYLGADEYRRAKGVLMSKLEERFGAMLKTCRTQHGEVRFESSDQQARWADLVDLCLKAFTPWSTCNACPVPSNFEGSEQKLPSQLSGKGASDADQNQIELNRCHAFIDPVCYGRLVRGLSIEPPGERLDLPRFFMEMTDSSNHPDLPPQPPQLSAEERKAIADDASTQAERRQKAAPTMLIVVVDGKERAHLDLAHTTGRQFEIDEGAELVEIWTEYQGEPLLLATHKIAYADAQGFAPANFSLRFKDRAELVLQISGAAKAQEGPRTATILLTYHPARGEERLASWWHTAPKFALASAALIALGWFLGMSAHRMAFTVQPTPPEFVHKSPPQPLPTATLSVTATTYEVPATYRLVSDDASTRGSGNSDAPSVVVPPHPVLVHLELPIAAADASKLFRSALKPFLKNEEILIENRLRAHRGAAGVTIVTFSLPSTLLEADADYTVDLRSHSSRGELEELNTYTFHAVKNPK
jgi:hypothetical protein